MTQSWGLATALDRCFTPSLKGTICAALQNLKANVRLIVGCADTRVSFLSLGCPGRRRGALKERLELVDPSCGSPDRQAWEARGRLDARLCCTAGPVGQRGVRPTRRCVCALGLCPRPPKADRVLGEGPVEGAACWCCPLRSCGLDSGLS